MQLTLRSALAKTCTMSGVKTLKNMLYTGEKFMMELFAKIAKKNHYACLGRK